MLAEAAQPIQYTDGWRTVLSQIQEMAPASPRAVFPEGAGEIEIPAKFRIRDDGSIATVSQSQRG